MAPRLLLAAVLALAATAAAPPEPGPPLVALEGSAAARAGDEEVNGGRRWRLGAPASAGERVRPVFMLRHASGRLRALEELLWDVSTPGSPRYGQHLSRAQAAEQLPPVEGALEAVQGWLRAHGVEGVSVSPSGDMVEAAMPVSVAEEMFGCRFHHFTWGDADAADIIRATTPYSVPADLAAKLYVVGDLAQLPSVREPRRVGAALSRGNASTGPFPASCGAACGGLVTPEVLRRAYGVPDGPAAGAAKTTGMAVAEFQGVYYDAKDLELFRSTCRLSTPVTVDRQIGRNRGRSCSVGGGGQCLEALLDIEYIKAVGGDVPLTDIFSLRYSLLQWARRLDSVADIPLVHSVSYGNDEAQQTSRAFMDAVNAQFMKLGARGVSILFASGDQGVYGRSGVGPRGRFHPDFPGASPYVTSVGGTDFAVQGVIGEEAAWQDSGGGFSDHFTAPPYQQKAVAGYQALAASKGALPAARLWNAEGRGYPDVAALGGLRNAYCVAVAGGFSGVAGTSASCPVVAGVVARLNALRAEQGQPPMGFLNPFIYQNPTAFQDVRQGENTGGGPHGFRALEGWDPATGFGTPIYWALATAALAAGEAAAPSLLVV